MRRDLISRIQALEAAARVHTPSIVRYGWMVKLLPDDFQGEKHRAVVGERSDGSGLYRWCEWEECPGPAPARN